MQRFDDLSDIPSDFGPSVVTIGNFDGVHRGHQALLRQVVDVAARRGLTSVALTFDPHPLAVLHPERAPQLIADHATRLERIAALGIDAVLTMPFTRELASLSPEAFVEQVFVESLDAQVVVVGRDTRFGVRNSGNVDTLRELGVRHGFEVIVLDDVVDEGGDGARFSSSVIREHLAGGDVEGAADVLDRMHEVRGVVVRGHQRGRELGFPTANLSAESTGLIPADGVYAGWLVRDALPDSDPEHRMPAAISVGTNPTFDDVPHRTVEAYVLDRDDLDLYDEHVRVEFAHRLRGNTKFESIETLIAQITDDVDRARALLTTP